MGIGKNKIQNRVGYINRESYNLFKEKYPENPTTYKQYIEVLKESTVAIHDHILDNPLGFKLPYNLGYIAVHKFKAKDDQTAVDWVNTRKLGRRIPLTNMHSFGYMYKIKYYPNPRVQPIKNFMFKAHRLLNRDLGKNIKQNLREYISIDRSYFSKRFNIDNYINNK